MAGNRRRVRVYLGVAALGLSLCLACGFLLWPEGPMEAARRRVPLGEGEAAVVAAVGRPPDGGWVAGQVRPGTVLVWVNRRDLRWLYVEFDEDGRAMKAEAGSADGQTVWDQVVALWPWW